MGRQPLALCAAKFRLAQRFRGIARRCQMSGRRPTRQKRAAIATKNSRDETRTELTCFAQDPSCAEWAAAAHQRTLPQVSTVPGAQTSPSQDHFGMCNPAGTSSAEWWKRAIVVVVAHAK